MSDPMIPSEGYVQFEWTSPHDPKDTRIHVVAVYGEARVHIDFDDDGGEGSKDLSRIVGTMPKILGYIRRELMIRNESADVDTELRELLGEDEV